MYKFKNTIKILIVFLILITNLFSNSININGVYAQEEEINNGEVVNEDSSSENYSVTNLNTSGDNYELTNESNSELEVVSEDPQPEGDTGEVVLEEQDVVSEETTIDENNSETETFEEPKSEEPFNNG